MNFKILTFFLLLATLSSSALAAETIQESSSRLVQKIQKEIDWSSMPEGAQSPNELKAQLEVLVSLAMGLGFDLDETESLFFKNIFNLCEGEMVELPSRHGFKVLKKTINLKKLLSSDGRAIESDLGKIDVYYKKTNSGVKRWIEIQSKAGA